MGTALDLGCSGGRDSIYLAQHGWSVTGVDVVARAIALAQQRAQQAGVDVRFVQRDVAAVSSLTPHGSCILLLDAGCFHGWSDEQRHRAAAGMDAVAATGAVLLLFAFTPGRRGPAPRGIAQAVLLECFPTWELNAARRR